MSISAGDRVKVPKISAIIKNTAQLQLYVDNALTARERLDPGLQWCSEAAVLPHHAGNVLCVAASPPVAILVLDNNVGIAAFPTSAVTVTARRDQVVLLKPDTRPFFREWRRLTELALQPAMTPLGLMQKVPLDGVDQLAGRCCTVIKIVKHNTYSGQYAFVVMLTNGVGPPLIACMHGSELKPMPAAQDAGAAGQAQPRAAEVGWSVLPAPAAVLAPPTAVLPPPAAVLEPAAVGAAPAYATPAAVLAPTAVGAPPSYASAAPAAVLAPPASVFSHLSVRSSPETVLAASAPVFPSLVQSPVAPTAVGITPPSVAVSAEQFVSAPIAKQRRLEAPLRQVGHRSKAATPQPQPSPLAPCPVAVQPAAPAATPQPQRSPLAPGPVAVQPPAPAPIANFRDTPAPAYQCRGIGCVAVAKLAMDDPDWVRKALTAPLPQPGPDSLCGTQPIKEFVAAFAVMEFDN
jgi:hypothetical protein